MPKPKTLTPISQSEYGKIFDTNRFKDGIYFIEKYLKQGKRVLAPFDLDNTVLSYSHTLGTDQWFDFDFREFITQGLSAAEAKDKTLPAYLQFVKRIHRDDVYVVEDDTPKQIRQLQQKGVETIALTSRGEYLLEDTLEQLSMFGLTFNQGKYKDNNQRISLDDEAIFYNGMILCAGQHKGKSLFECLDKTDMPEVVVMWDDKLSNLQKVQASIEEYNQQMLAKDKSFIPIQFVGIRYGKLDHLIQNVNPEVVRLQRQYFERILSDEHAKAILKAEAKKERQFYVDVSHEPDTHKVTLAISKPHIYDLLLKYFPDINNYRILGADKELHGKRRLTWQFQVDEDKFYDMFKKLGQHGLIANEQYEALEATFANKPDSRARTVTPAFEHSKYRLRPHRASGYNSKGHAVYDKKERGALRHS